VEFDQCELLYYALSGLESFNTSHNGHRPLLLIFRPLPAGRQASGLRSKIKFSNGLRRLLKSIALQGSDQAYISSIRKQLLPLVLFVANTLSLFLSLLQSLTWCTSHPLTFSHSHILTISRPIHSLACVINIAGSSPCSGVPIDSVATMCFFENFRIKNGSVDMSCQ